MSDQQSRLEGLDSPAYLIRKKESPDSCKFDYKVNAVLNWPQMNVMN